MKRPNIETHTLDKVSKKALAISISASTLLLIAKAAFSIWSVQSLHYCNLFLASIDNPFGGTFGFGSHHSSSCLIEALPPNIPNGYSSQLSTSRTIIPRSTYQNSISQNPSRILINIASSFFRARRFIYKSDCGLVAVTSYVPHPRNCCMEDTSSTMESLTHKSHSISLHHIALFCGANGTTPWLPKYSGYHFK
ncbi:unnamed protein product [Ilex paraguariensis]|uniref:Uncharacterized protein n=1 Tax=Ilex paraguariensis TaxID=185542 RepID=A0ABC8SPE4_9AQUA